GPARLLGAALLTWLLAAGLSPLCALAATRLRAGFEPHREPLSAWWQRRAAAWYGRGGRQARRLLLRPMEERRAWQSGVSPRWLVLWLFLLGLAILLAYVAAAFAFEEVLKGEGWMVLLGLLFALVLAYLVPFFVILTDERVQWFRPEARAIASE